MNERKFKNGDRVIITHYAKDDLVRYKNFIKANPPGKIVTVANYIDGDEEPYICVISESPYEAWSFSEDQLTLLIV